MPVSYSTWLLLGRSHLTGTRYRYWTYRLIKLCKPYQWWKRDLGESWYRWTKGLSSCRPYFRVHSIFRWGMFILTHIYVQCLWSLQVVAPLQLGYLKKPCFSSECPPEIKVVLIVNYILFKCFLLACRSCTGGNSQWLYWIFNTDCWASISYFIRRCLWAESNRSSTSCTT